MASRRDIRDEDIRPWLPIIDYLAQSLAASPKARQAGVEFDDLRQEGMLSVTLSLLRGVDPRLAIGNRMKDWIRFQQRQRRGDSLPYETILPTEAPGGVV